MEFLNKSRASAGKAVGIAIALCAVAIVFGRHCGNTKRSRVAERQIYRTVEFHRAGRASIRLQFIWSILRWTACE